MSSSKENKDEQDLTMLLFTIAASRFPRRALLHRSLSSPAFVFSPENFKNPNLPPGLEIKDVETVEATEESLHGFGKLVNDPSSFCVENGTFEITPWPHVGWRPLDPKTGDEAGTTEGNFDVEWIGDFFYGKNLAIASDNNQYLDGLGVPPEIASQDEASASSDEEDEYIYLWMSDHHPDGGQLFWPHQPTPFTVCLGKSDVGDDVTPSDMRAFHVPAGKGVYIHPGTWHNGIYVSRLYTPATFLTRQGRVHARVSCSWAEEFGCLLRVPLNK